MIKTTTVRMNWLDAARIAAAFCIIAIHSTTDAYGWPFRNAQEGERLFTILFRTTAELVSTEYFILVSLFLLAFKLERKPTGYQSTLKLQARRLLVPFAVWTVFYAFFSLFKAYQFGYGEDALNGLMNPLSWVDYFLLGSSQYHMHFLPTLFALILFYPLYQLATRYPLLGLVLIPLLFIREYLTGWLWGHVPNQDVLEYLVHGVKILSYVGYGMAAYALFGWWKTKLDRDTSMKIMGFALFALCLFFMIKLIQAGQSIESGEFAVRTGAFYYVHYLIPVLSLTIFMASQHLNWPDKLSDWSKYTFGMYLVHPAIIDIFDVLVMGIEFQPYQYTVLKYAVAASASLGVAILLGRTALLAWTVGLGPLPFAAKKTKADKPAKSDIETTSDTKAGTLGVLDLTDLTDGPDSRTAN
ncbi:MAG: Acyltransferase [uncultured Thiotrichaceae bacterium]|uniref:Acyltransferase n=1 Tax=uncultured Thiotrichaceae bacterium TaxID=298394 RepID=A0A6S6RW18_9GAMM|nr:MAG: Acyltransferase [uncultured Thiotrichaceae bacterium]